MNEMIMTNEGLRFDMNKCSNSNVLDTTGINTPNEVKTCENEGSTKTICEYSQLPLKKTRKTRSDKGKKRGIKYDADKPRLAEMILDFKEPLVELAKVWGFGANKYGKSNWKELKDGKDRYTNALTRHLFAEDDNLYDDETKLYHAAHIAFNALARLYFIMQEEK